MPGLVRGVARTAAIAGTATAVSNRVSRRQAGRWADQDQQQAAEQAPPPAAYQQAPPPPAAPPPPQVVVMQAPPPAPVEQDMSAKLGQLQQLADLHTQGILSDAEFDQQKQRILSS